VNHHASVAHQKLCFSFRWTSFLSVIAVFLLVQDSDAQPRKSHAFRTTDPGPSALIVESDPSAQLLEGFILIQKANSGDPVAEQ
jgi:hypothetical protein